MKMSHAILIVALDFLDFASSFINRIIASFMISRVCEAFQLWTPTYFMFFKTPIDKLF